MRRNVRKLKRCVHRIIPRRWYREIPMDELKQMYKKRFQRLMRSKKVKEDICSGLTVMVYGGYFFWLLFFGA